jgi:hypothetical protein
MYSVFFVWIAFITGLITGIAYGVVTDNSKRWLIMLGSLLLYVLVVILGK